MNHFTSDFETANLIAFRLTKKYKKYFTTEQNEKGFWGVTCKYSNKGE